MSEQIDLPTSRGSLAVEWACFSPQQRCNAIRLFGSILDAVADTADAAVSPESRAAVAAIAEADSDPEGLAFIDHMDAIAVEAVPELYGCIATLQGGER